MMKHREEVVVASLIIRATIRITSDTMRKNIVGMTAQHVVNTGKMSLATDLFYLFDDSN